DPRPTTLTTVAPCSSGHGEGVACAQRRVASQVDRQTFATRRTPIKLELASAVQFQVWTKPDRCQRLASYAAKARAFAKTSLSRMFSKSSGGISLTLVLAMIKFGSHSVDTNPFVASSLTSVITLRVCVHVLTRTRWFRRSKQSLVGEPERP